MLSSGGASFLIFGGCLIHFVLNTFSSNHSDLAVSRICFTSVIFSAFTMVELEWLVRFEGLSLFAGMEVVSVSVTTFSFLTFLFLTVTVFALLDVWLEVAVEEDFLDVLDFLAVVELEELADSFSISSLEWLLAE